MGFLSDSFKKATSAIIKAKAKAKSGSSGSSSGSKSKTRRDIRKARRQATTRRDVVEARRAQLAYRRGNVQKAQTILDRANEHKYNRPGGMTQKEPTTAAKEFVRRAQTQPLPSMRSLEQPKPTMMGRVGAKIQAFAENPITRAALPLAAPGIRSVGQLMQNPRQSIRQFPKELFNVSGGEDIYKFGRSLQEAPKAIFQEARGKKFQAPTYNVPLIGKRKSFIGEAQERAGAIVEGKEPLYTALKPFAQVPLAGAQIAGIAKSPVGEKSVKFLQGKPIGLSTKDVSRELDKVDNAIDSQLKNLEDLRYRGVSDKNYQIKAGNKKLNELYKQKSKLQGGGRFGLTTQDVSTTNQKKESTIISQMGKPKNTDPACVQIFRKIKKENPSAVPIRGIYDTDLASAASKYERNVKTGMQKQLGGFTHLKADVNGKLLDSNPTIPKGAIFFSEDQIKSAIPSGKSKGLPKTGLPQPGMGENIVENQGRVPYTTNQAQLPEGVKQRGFPKTVAKSGLAPKELSEQLAEQTYNVKPNEETASRVKAILELGEDQALKVARDANHPESNATALKLMEDALKKNEFQKFSTLNKEFSPRFTKQGQQIQIISKFGKLTPTGAVRYAEHIVEEANRLSGSKLKLTDEVMGKIKGLAEEVAKAPEGREKTVAIARMLDKIAEQVPEGIGKKVATLQTMAQLLNPKTAIRNIIGNVALGGTETATDVVGTGVDKLLSKIIPKWERSMGLPSLAKQLSGAKKGFKLGLEDAMLGIDTSGFGTKFDLPTRTFRKGILSGVEKAMNVELRATDRAFYQGAFDDAINSMMKAAKVQKPTQEMLAQAGEEALYRTFQNNSLLANAMVKLKKGLNFGKDFGIGDLINKYPKTPANIVNVGMDYSPLGVLKVAKQVYDITKGIKSVGQIGVRRDLVKQISRALVGTGIIGTGYVLAKNGIVTGKAEKDRDISTLQKITGGGPFRLNISALQRMAKGEDANPKNGDLQISYDWLQPNAIPFSIGVNMALGDKKAEDALNVAIEGLESGVDTLTQQPVIQGVKRFSQDFSGKGLVRAVGNQLAGAPASFVPTIVNQIRQKFGNNVTRETYDPNVFKEGLNRAMAKVPGLENKLPERINQLGQPAETYQGGTNSVVNVFFNPAFVSRIDESPEAKMVLDLYRTTGEKGQIPRIAPEFIKDENGNRIDLTSDQYVAFQKYIGQRTQDEFSKLASSEGFNSMSDVEKVNKLTSLLTSISADAKKEILGIGKGSGKSDEAFIKYTELKGLSDEEFFNKVAEMKKAGGDQEIMADTMRKYRANDTAKEMGFDTVDDWSSMSISDRGRKVEEKMQSISEDDRAKLFGEMIRRDLVSDQMVGDIVKRKLITADRMMAEDVGGGTKAKVLYEEMKGKTNNFFEGDPDREAKLREIEGGMQDMIVNGLRQLDASPREKEQQMETIKTEFKAYFQDDKARKAGLTNEEERWSKMEVNDRANVLVDKVWGMEKPQAEEYLMGLEEQKLITDSVKEEFKYQWKKRLNENQDQIMKEEEQKQAMYDEAAGLIQRKLNGEQLTPEEEQRITLAMQTRPANLENPLGEPALATPAGFQAAGTMRTDRHNNPTAFTTDVAKTAGWVEGVDYEVGDPFPGNPNLRTAKIIGDPVEKTIELIDKVGFFTESGKQRWSYIAMQDEDWQSLSKESKIATIAKMYATEGGNGSLMNSPAQQYAMTPEQTEIATAVGTGQMTLDQAVDAVMKQPAPTGSAVQIPMATIAEEQAGLTTIPAESRTSQWLAQQNFPYWQSAFNIYYVMGMYNMLYQNRAEPGIYSGMEEEINPSFI